MAGAGGADAATLFWDGGGNGFSWTANAGANWNPDAIPTVADDLILNNSAGIVPAGMTIDAVDIGVRSITFANNFNPTNTTVIGDVGAEDRTMTLGSAANSWTIASSAASGSITFLPQLPASGGNGNLRMNLAFNGVVSVTSAGASIVLNTVISSSAGSAGISKIGAGTLILGGANTYSGNTAISGGALLVNNATGSGTGTGLVTLAGAGSLLGGTGAIAGAVTVNSGGTITGGANGTVGTLTLRSGLTLNGGTGNPASYAVDLSGATADRLTITGLLNLSGTLDRIIFNGTADGTSTYVLATYTSLSGVFDTVSNLPPGYILNYGATELSLVPVPEPGTLSAAGALLAGALVWRRRSGKA